MVKKDGLETYHIGEETLDQYLSPKEQSRLRAAAAILNVLVARLSHGGVTVQEYRRKVAQAAVFLGLTSKQEVHSESTPFAESTIPVICQSKERTYVKRDGATIGVPGDITMHNGAMKNPMKPKETGRVIINGVVGSYVIEIDYEHRLKLKLISLSSRAKKVSPKSWFGAKKPKISLNYTDGSSRQFNIGAPVDIEFEDLKSGVRVNFTDNSSFFLEDKISIPL